jgi:hypothetical protein
VGVTIESSVIDAERLKDEFLDLVCISSLSKLRTVWLNATR